MRQSEAERSQPAGSWLEFLNIYKSNNGPRPIGLGGRHKQTGRWIRIHPTTPIWDSPVGVWNLHRTQINETTVSRAHESGYEMNIWSFAGFAFSQSGLSPPLPTQPTSSAEPALATWPQLKMRKVDEKSKKFSVSPRSLSLPLSRSACLPLFPSHCQQRNEMKFSVELPAAHAPSKTGGSWNGRFCWVAVASASRHTETGTLPQLQLQQHMGQKEIWKGGSGETHSRHI